MKVTNTRSRTVKTYWLAGTDGEVRDVPYTRTGKQYRVSRITVVKQDGSVYSVETSGSVIKKDGAEGQNEARERFHSEVSWPAWLRSIVGGLA